MGAEVVRGRWLKDDAPEGRRERDQEQEKEGEERFNNNFVANYVSSML